MGWMGWVGLGWDGLDGNLCGHLLLSCDAKNDIRDVGSTADLVLVFLVHLVHWYLGSLCEAIV